MATIIINNNIKNYVVMNELEETELIQMNKNKTNINWSQGHMKKLLELFNGKFDK